jgi:energy-coupling factor transporter ATP-binding protein EcfA2
MKDIENLLPDPENVPPIEPGGEADKVQGDAVDARGSQGLVYKPSSPVTQTFGYTFEQVMALIDQISRAAEPRRYDGRPPYRGLAAYQEGDAELFYGREQLLEELLARLQRARFVCLAGPSGSGKSSLAHAGLLHALRQGQLEGSLGWLVESLNPGAHPLEQLAVAMSAIALRAGTQPKTAGDYVRQNGLKDARALHDLVELIARAGPGQRAVLLVDQFEESFTLAKDDAERSAFIDLLTAAVQQEGGRTTVILAMRSDFLSQCAAYPALRQLISQEFQLVGAMDPDELARAIALPALEVGVAIEPQLVAQVIADMKGEPGALPLMQFALKDLFDSHQPKKGDQVSLTLADYLGRGGLQQALQHHADAALGKLNPAEQAIARYIFTKLIDIEHITVVTRRAVTFAGLLTPEVDQDSLEKVVQTLSDARLITTGELEPAVTVPTEGVVQPTITLAHERLIEAWPWLKRLVDEDRQAIILANHVEDDAQEWDGKGRDASYLYHGARLAAARAQLAEKSLDLSGLGQAFLAAGQAQQVEAERRDAERRQALVDAERRRKLILGLIGGAAGFALAYLATYWKQGFDNPLLPFVTLIRTLPGAIAGLIFILFVDMARARYQGPRRWTGWAISGLGGAVAFSLALFFNAILASISTPVTLVLILIEGVLWGLVAGLGTFWAMVARRPLWQTLPGVAVASGLVLWLAEDGFGHAFLRPGTTATGGAGPSPGFVFLAGAILPLFVAAAAVVGKWRGQEG